MEQFDRVEPVLMVRDVSRALAFYAQLGFEEVFRDDHAPMFAMVARDALTRPNRMTVGAGTRAGGSLQGRAYSRDAAESETAPTSVRI